MPKESKLTQDNDGLGGQLSSIKARLSEVNVTIQDQQRVIDNFAIENNDLKNLNHCLNQANNALEAQFSQVNLIIEAQNNTIQTQDSVIEAQNNTIKTQNSIIEVKDNIIIALKETIEKLNE